MSATGNAASPSVVAAAKRLVIKVGSTLVTNDGRGLDQAAIARWAGQIAKLRSSGKQVILVSSGAIAEGMQRLGWTKRPHAIILALPTEGASPVELRFSSIKAAAALRIVSRSGRLPSKRAVTSPWESSVVVVAPRRIVPS